MDQQLIIWINCNSLDLNHFIIFIWHSIWMDVFYSVHSLYCYSDWLHFVLWYIKQPVHVCRKFNIMFSNQWFSDSGFTVFHYQNLWLVISNLQICICTCIYMYIFTTVLRWVCLWDHMSLERTGGFWPWPSIWEDNLIMRMLQGQLIPPLMYLSSTPCNIFPLPT